MKRTSYLKSDSSEKKHLNIVISDSDPDDNVLVVNCTTLRNTGREDLSCVINPGEHHFITDKSYITYNYAKEVSCFQIVQLKLKCQIIRKDDISIALLQKIQKGAKLSKFLPSGLIKYFDYF